MGGVEQGTTINTYLHLLLVHPGTTAQRFICIVRRTALVSAGCRELAVFVSGLYNCWRCLRPDCTTVGGVCVRTVQLLQVFVSGLYNCWRCLRPDCTTVAGVCVWTVQLLQVFVSGLYNCWREGGGGVCVRLYNCCRCLCPDCTTAALRLLPGSCTDRFVCLFVYLFTFLFIFFTDNLDLFTYSFVYFGVAMGR